MEHGYLDDILYTDAKSKSIRFPEANPGNVIGYEWETEKRPYVFEDSWTFQRLVPVKQARFELSLPAGVGIQGDLVQSPAAGTTGERDPGLRLAGK